MYRTEKHSLIFCIFIVTLILNCIYTPLYAQQKAITTAYTQFEAHLRKLEKTSLPFITSNPEENQRRIIDNIHSISQDEHIFFDWEGYTITATLLSEKFSKSFVQEFINDNHSRIPSMQTDTIGGKTMYIRSVWQEIQGSDTVLISVYMWPGADSLTNLLDFRTSNIRNTAYEKMFCDLYRLDLLPGFILLNQQTNSFRFCGREITLPMSCSWLNISNLQCSGKGQMNWSQFLEIQSATHMLRSFMYRPMPENSTKEDARVVPVIFEGVPAKALRLRIRLHMPKEALGGSNLLIAYYVVAPVRNRYVACVMSHFDDEAPANALPELLSMVMKLKK